MFITLIKIFYNVDLIYFYIFISCSFCKFLYLYNESFFDLKYDFNSIFGILNKAFSNFNMVYLIGTTLIIIIILILLFSDSPSFDLPDNVNGIMIKFSIRGNAKIIIQLLLVQARGVFRPTHTSQNTQ